MTFFPSRRLTYGVLYGCDKNMKEAILARLHNSEGAASHPLLLIGIFAELERKRQLGLVQNALSTLHDTIIDLSKPVDDWEMTSVHGHSSATNAVDSWLDVYDLKNALESWKAQLGKIVSHIDEISETWFSPLASDLDEKKAEKRQLEEVGERIRERMLEIVSDYDTKIRECDKIMEGMNLATQLVSTLNAASSFRLSRLTIPRPMLEQTSKSLHRQRQTAAR